MRSVDRLSHFPDVLRRFAFRLDCIGVNVGSVAKRKISLGVVQVLNLRLQQRVDGPVWIVCALRGPGHWDKSHFIHSLLVSRSLFYTPNSGQSVRMVASESRFRFGSTGICFRLRSEEHTSELQSLTNLVCRLLL